MKALLEPGPTARRCASDRLWRQPIARVLCDPIDGTSHNGVVDDRHIGRAPQDHARIGSYSGMPMKRTFNIVWVAANHGVGGDVTQAADASVAYDGSQWVVAGR